MDFVIILEDWYSIIDLTRGRIVMEAIASITRQHQNARFYEFLPVGTLSHAKSSDAAAIAAVPGVVAIFETSSSFGEARGLYHKALSALSAVRSQSAHQRWAWWSARSDGQSFPNPHWCGGIWPPQPYPTLDSSSGELTCRDPAIIKFAEPASISVISLSIEPALPARNDVYDPLMWALTAVSETHLVVVAAGNDGPDAASMNPWSLARGVMAVGAAEGHSLWRESSRGSADGNMKGPDVVANGVVDRPMCVGTSFAAPRVARLALILTAILSQLNAELHAAQGHSFGIPGQALAVVDIPAKSVHTEAAAIVPFLDLPALPHIGLRSEPVVEAFRQILQSAPHTGIAKSFGGQFVSPSLLIAMIRAAARPIAGCAVADAGAGFVSDDLLLDYLCGMTIGDLFEAFGIWAPAPPSLASEVAFDRAGLKSLAAVVKLSRPLLIWDIQNRGFFLSRSLKVEGGRLADLEQGILAAADPQGGGHLARVVYSSVT